MNILKPKKPKNSDWVFLKYCKDTLGYDQYWYTLPKHGFIVCSALEVTNGILRDEFIPQYHISMSKLHGMRCTRNDAKAILKAFDLSDALEDNHRPGIARNYYLPVDENQIGRECACTETETAIKEDKGDFIWRPADH